MQIIRAKNCSADPTQGTPQITSCCPALRGHLPSSPGRGKVLRHRVLACAAVLHLPGALEGQAFLGTGVN